MEPNSQDFEKLGVFYLGKQNKVSGMPGDGELLLYDSKDLTTHAVVVGMTGSGKTGLCVNLLEEAALDRIPAIVIDPKGDISNLLLTFPNLKPEDFLPWVDPGQASRQGQSREEFAQSESEKWKNGLASWGQTGERIRAMRENVEMRVYTPGSTAGRPVTILKSFGAPTQELLDDSDLLRERISSATSGLLSLLGIDVDPIRSREHILVSKILEHSWTQRKDLDLGQLIGQIKSPPFTAVGIMEIDEFYPAKDRGELAMTLNNLLASPSFGNWLTGETLDVKKLLHNEDGKPCISILSISHLSDGERMFFVTILLNEVLAWMRSQAGTSSLRALLYMDEVFGYFPPVKNPPSKTPMLTLLKQARAYGLGVVLATQNPVDLDYKGLSNAGTWFLGRLQTERDKARVIEGLEGAATQTGSSFDKSRMEQILAGLSNRVFLMNNVHDDHPVVFETRWAMSYLRGPMTRQQIQQLLKTELATPAAAQPETWTVTPPMPEPESTKELPSAGDPNGPGATTVKGGSRGLIPSDVKQSLVAAIRKNSAADRLLYRPALWGRGRLHYVKTPLNIDVWADRFVVRSIRDDSLPLKIWDGSEVLNATFDFVDIAPESAEFAAVPAAMQSSKNYRAWAKDFVDHLYQNVPLKVTKCVELGIFSGPDETLGEFKVRLETVVSEQRDTAKEKLQQKYAQKFQTVRNEISRGLERVEREQSQLKSKRLDSILTVGTSIMGALLGRKRISSANAGRASSSMKSIKRYSDESKDLSEANDSLEDAQKTLRDLESEFNREHSELANKLQVEQLTYSEVEIPPRKGDMAVEEIRVVWLPTSIDISGAAILAY